MFEALGRGNEKSTLVFLRVKEQEVAFVYKSRFEKDPRFHIFTRTKTRNPNCICRMVEGSLRKEKEKYSKKSLKSLF